MVDIATRVWNHKWKIDPIVRSLIDDDFYKLLMCQSVFHNHPDTRVTDASPESYSASVLIRWSPRAVICSLTLAISCRGRDA